MQDEKKEDFHKKTSEMIHLRGLKILFIIMKLL